MEFPTVMSQVSVSCGLTEDWAWLRSLWYNPVSTSRLDLLGLTIFDAETAMRDVFGAKFVSLHVRHTNRSAIGLYRDTLGFSVHEVEKGYCT